MAGSSQRGFATLLREIEHCAICRDVLPVEPRPVVQAAQSSRILIAGQAPGRKVFESGIPFDDASGVRLRNWMGVTKDQFYDPAVCAIVPMGFCYPGSGSSGDLPPRPECEPAWRSRLTGFLTRVDLTLVIGAYAIRHYLPAYRGNVTKAVTAWESHYPDIVPLPHPSPRNIAWFKRNPWFEEQLIPILQKRVASLLT